MVALSAAEFRAAIAAQVAAHDDAVFVRAHTPDLATAMRAEREGTAEFADHLRLAVHYLAEKRSDEARQAWEEAEKLAEDLLRRAKAGEDFDSLVREHTDDAHPGIYKMSNHGVPAPPGGFPRGGMVPAFGDVGFPLEVGGVGLAAYDPAKSRYGWHVIKRIE